ncbi:hypothetical protein FACS1894160_1850 [Bacteroidia bacterium]|nr:hypothetical protein FACS1894160_1850 [Bacteroidia bacterium]
MKTKIIFIIIVGFCLPNFTVSADQKYYYAYNKKIFLNEVENKVMISCCASDIFTIKKALAENSNATKTEWKNDSICIVTMESSQYKPF